MRILIIADYYQTTIGYSEVQVAKNLIKKRHQVRVCTSNKYFPYPNYETTVKQILGERKRPVGFKVEDGIPIERKQAVFDIFSRCFFFGVKKQIEKYKPDLVLVNGASSCSVIQTALAKKYYNFKLVITDTHLPSELTRGNQTLKNFFYFLFRLFFSNVINNAADKIIALQEDTRKVIKHYYGIKKVVCLIDQGTDINKFKFDKKGRGLLRRKYDLKEKDFVILYTGKIIPAKGVHLLFQAMNILLQKHPDIYLCLVGGCDEKYKKECIELLNKEYSKYVIWVDFQLANQLYKYYSFCDVAVWPLQESLSMNDAASCSRPFIANDTLGVKTRISNNNALLYKKDDQQDLAKKIEFLYLNPFLRKQMGKNGRELAEKKLNWFRISEEFIKV